MTHWQARATLENGAVMVFGAQAHTDEDAVGLAETRLADTGQAVLDIEIEPLVCFGAAQAMAAAEDFRCSVCSGPAPDKDRDVSVVARAADWLGVYFFLCARCCTADAGG